MSSSSVEFVEAFLQARNLLLDEMMSKAERTPGIKRDQLFPFTFADSLVLAYRTDAKPTLDQVRGFCDAMRRFIVKSLPQRILWRGSIGVGDLYLALEDRAVMGPAVADAAAWYASADWIGVNATPRASLFVQSLIDDIGADDAKIDHVIVDYDVPLKETRTLNLKAVNWPKGFFVRGMTPAAGKNKRAACLSLLAEHDMPRRTEVKYLNTVAFFDHCGKLWKEQQKRDDQRNGESEHSS